MSADRKFTLNLRQNNTGKTAQIIITQQGKAFVPEYVFEVDKKEYNVGSDRTTITINYTSYKTTESGGRVPIKPTAEYKNDYSLSINKPKITVNAPDNNGRGTIIAEIRGNYSYDNEDIEIIYVKQRGEVIKTITITVHTAAKPDNGVFKADPTTLSYSSDGGTKTSAITSTSKGKTVGWSVMDKSSVPDWVTYSGESTGTLSVTTKANN